VPRTFDTCESEKKMHTSKVLECPRRRKVAAASLAKISEDVSSFLRESSAAENQTMTTDALPGFCEAPPPCDSVIVGR
jgi:hypothetical protein